MQLREHVKRLTKDETFCFACHAGVECFTECCRELELALTPYDVLRLKNILNLRSTDFLDRFVLIEKDENELFPRFYLTMVDDGSASCPFVSADGCKVYESRPGACRTYPLGRAVSMAPHGQQREFHVLLTEPHCQGFGCSACFTALEWTDDQELVPYNALNDDVMTLLQHEKVRQGIKLNEEQIKKFTLALYNLDEFRALVLKEDILSLYPLSLEDKQAISTDDTALLQFGIRWLKNELFGDGRENDQIEYPLGREMTEDLCKIAGRFRDGEGGCHGPDHAGRVYRTALYIGRLMGARLDILGAAALLHDIGRPYEREKQGAICHAEKGAELAGDILKDMGFSQSMTQDIIHCIETHRYRGDKVPSTLEAKILFDADKLDSIGAIGIGRAFLFAGQVGAKLHNSDIDIIGSRSYSTEDTAYREFKVKLSKVKDRLLTPEGRRLAEERHAFMELYFHRLEREINGATEK